MYTRKNLLGEYKCPCCNTSNWLYAELKRPYCVAGNWICSEFHGATLIVNCMNCPGFSRAKSLSQEEFLELESTISRDKAIEVWLIELGMSK